MLSSFDLLLIVASLVVMIVGFARRSKMWRQGNTDNDSDNRQHKGIVNLISYLMTHRKILENRYRGIAHLFIFWGVIIPFGVVLISQFGPIIPSGGAKGLSLLLDVVGLFALAGTGMLIFDKYRSHKTHSQNLGIHLWVLLAILITGFAAEGIRLAITLETTKLSTASFSPVGWAASYLMPASPIFLKLIIRAHFFLVLFFIAYLPFSVMRHVVTSALNVYYQPKTQGGTIKPIVLEGDYFGVGKPEDFTRTQLLNSDACTDCGRCEDICPAHMAGQSLSPKEVIRHIRHAMETPNAHSNNGGNGSNGLLTKEGTIGRENIWSCTTCMACVEACPVFVGQLPKIVDLRQYSLLTESRFPREYKQVFKNLEVFGDTSASGSLTREDWVANLKVQKAYEDNHMDILLWVGCTGALYDERAKSVTTATVSILNKAGIRFGILGKQELCCGDPVRRMGNEYLFQKLVNKNIETLKRHNVKKIVTYCPHCFNVLRNEYPQFGADFEVIHLTQFLKTLLADGRLKLREKIEGNYTYHDPCYLGRYNETYQPPRDVLEYVFDSKIPEMTLNRENAFCCGAGGGNFWRGKITGRRMEELRIDQAVETGADGIITACPFCEIMFNSAIVQKGLAHSFQLTSLIQLINQASE